MKLRVSPCVTVWRASAYGAVIGNQARFLREQVTFAGRATTWNRTAESGNVVTFHFCPTCGSTVYWESESFPGYVAVAIGNFANAISPCRPSRCGRSHATLGSHCRPTLRPSERQAGVIPESSMLRPRKARAVGFNHVALEVGDIEEALAFYGRLFDFKLRGKSDTSAFIDLGDQFLALQKGRTQAADEGRHFGLVVDDKEAVRKALAAAGIDALPGRFLDFLDPWGNRIEIVGYDNVQFTKAPNVLRGMDWNIFQRTRQRSRSSLTKACGRTEVHSTGAKIHAACDGESRRPRLNAARTVQAKQRGAGP